ncbi:Lysostaphin [Microbacterium oleivorans]|uniref:M23 family metallopeptidase n=1 Tax=Microbacterium oleivorans TaxID=273677 RepID=UPI000F8CA860|nr:M23 family metallopeptidase [Microbacterium oleivorans]AZS45070.1 Lysostaphin [Microbacterium oleivorans]
MNESHGSARPPLATGFSRRQIVTFSLASIGMALVTSQLPLQPAAAAAGWTHPFAERAQYNDDNPFGRYRPEIYTSPPHRHRGSDFIGSGDTRIRAVRPGKVVHAGTESWASGQLGQVVVIQHDDYWSLYAHMQDGSLTVGRNDTVTNGTPLGRMGSTGKANGAHLHIEIGEGAWNNQRPFSALLDPYPLVGKAPRPGSNDPVEDDMPVFVRNIDTRSRSLTSGTWYNVALSEEGGTSFASGKCLVNTTVVVRLYGLDPGAEVQFRLVRTKVGTDTIRDGTAVREAVATGGATYATVSDSFELKQADDGLRWQYAVFQSGVTVDRTETTALVFG